MDGLVRQGIPPVDLFRILHHPRQKYVSPDQIALDFRHGEPHFMMSTQADVAADLVSLARAAEPDAGEWHRSPHITARWPSLCRWIATWPGVWPGVASSQTPSAICASAETMPDASSGP